jgi:two-component system, NtrC family, sensor kinase
MSETRRRPTLRFLIALAGTAVVLALGALSFQRRVEAFQPLGFEARPTAAGTLEVMAVRAAGVGVEVGDQILIAGGAEAHEAASLRGRLRHAPTTTMVVARGERLETITYQRPPLEIDWRYLLLSLIAGVYLLIGLYTLLREPERPAFLFTLWCLASAAVYLLSPLDLRDTAGRAIYLVEELARLLLPPLTLQLFLVFPPGLETPRGARRIAPFLYLPATVLLVLQADLAATGGRLLFGKPTTASLALLDRLELVHLALYALAAIAVLGLLLRRHPAWEQRRQLQWIALGLAAGYLPFVLLYAAPRAAGWSVSSPLASAAVVPLAIVPLTFAYAILRYKLWDLGPIVRDAAAYTMTLLVGLLGFSLVNLGISRGVPEDMALARSLFTFSAGLGIATLMVPTKRGIAASLERLQYGTTFSRRRALADAGRELLHERDLDALCAAMLRHLEAGLDLERCNLLLAQGGALLPVRPEPGLPTHFQFDSLGADFWSHDVETLSGVGLPQASVPPVQRLFLAGYRYAFPLLVRDSRVGVALCSNRRGHAPLSGEDVDLVRSVLNQAALAIENAQLVDQLQRRLDDMVRMERQTQGILESSPAGIAVLDEHDRVQSTNLAFAALVGKSRPDTIGRRLSELLPLHPLPLPGQGMIEVSFCDAEGVEKHFQLTVAALAGRVGGGDRVLVAQDVSDRVAMEAALKEKDRLASLGMLAAGVAHEVNTPITGISSYAQMLIAETPEGDPRHDLLRKVEKQTFRAARIVNSLLELARDRQGDARPLDIGELLAESADLLRERLEKRRVVLHVERGAAPLEVLGNDGELQQVFTNLLLNAADAMPQGGEIFLAACLEGDRARVTVRDTGSGIPESARDKIFQPFFTTKTGQGGTGLGLAISQSIVERHGGTLRADNDPRGGAEFTVELPLRPGP